MPMKLVFIYGPPAAGKLTIARKVAEQTNLPVFHNHLIVDAVGAVFPFGSAHFKRLREKFWFETFEAAVDEGQSLIFTYLPEDTVSPNFVPRVIDLVVAHGGQVVPVRLDASRESQLARIANTSRNEFGKLQDADLLKANFDQFERTLADMPPPDLVIDTETVDADRAAEMIVAQLSSQ